MIELDSSMRIPNMLSSVRYIVNSYNPLFFYFVSDFQGPCLNMYIVMENRSTLALADVTLLTGYPTQLDTFCVPYIA